METPAPVNLNALKGILANAKKVMNKVEGEKPVRQKNTREDLYESNNTRLPIYDENDEREPEYTSYSPSQTQQNYQNGYTTEQVMASKLPQNVKEAMIKNPIPQLQMPPSKFTLEDMGDLNEKKTNKGKLIINESRTNVNSDMITISKTELKEMINESLVQFLTQSYNKTLTEDTIKKTINMLIKEGKLNVKKKTI